MKRKRNGRKWSCLIVEKMRPKSLKNERGKYRGRCSNMNFLATILWRNMKEGRKTWRESKLIKLK